jgi:hypothetical protein
MAARKKPAEEAKAKVSSRSRAKEGNGAVGAARSHGPLEGPKTRIARTRQRLMKHVNRLRSFGLPDPHIVKHLDAGLKSLELAVDGLEAIPEDWRPLRGTIGGPSLEPGSVVHLKDQAKVVDRYGGLIDAGTDLKVIKLVAGRIVCEADVDGAKFRQVVPRSHVRA